jgi:hypothetical protein
MNKTVFAFLVITFSPFIQVNSQIIIFDSLFFEEGKSILMPGSSNTLQKIPGQIKGLKEYEIYLKAYKESPKSENVQSAIVDERLQIVCKYLIDKNMGSSIRDVEIVSNEKVNPESGHSTMNGNMIIVSIKEKFPEPYHSQYLTSQSSEAFIENDTIFSLSSGIQIKISAGSFAPSKISDYRFEIKEILSSDDFAYNNMSTQTSDRRVIRSAAAIFILVTPRLSSTPIPIRIQKPVILLFPMHADSASYPKISIFDKATDSKSFTTWEKTNEHVMIEHYGGKEYYMVSLTRLGWVLLGEFVSACNCCIIQTPHFQHEKMNIIYLDRISVISFDDRFNIFQIPCTENGIRIKIFASDSKGRIFLFDRTINKFAKTGMTQNVIKIRKRDFEKL